MDPVRLLPRRGNGDKDPRPFLLRGMKACGSSGIAGRYRRLRQFAAEAQDYEREREFFAQEMRARRFFLDKPFGKGIGRFWFGWIYGGVADFGRSFARPLVVWALSIPLFALAYLAARVGVQPASSAAPAVEKLPGLPSWPQQANVQAVLHWLTGAGQWLALSMKQLFSTDGCVAGNSSATAEAFFLSLKNSLFFLGWESQDAARRVYGCLYGFDEGSPGPLALRVPLSISTTAIAQNVVSAFLLFLVLLAIRNILKTR